MRRERGVVLIIAYKLVKGGLWFVFAATILVMMHMGLGNRMQGFAAHLRLHAHPWSLRLASVVVEASTRRALKTIVVALLADGTVTLIEGWALLHGHWWGPWLVVVATGALLPLEVVSLIRHPRPIRAALLLVNLTIVVYLAWTALRERRERLERRPSSPPSPERPSGSPPHGASPPA